MPGDLLEASRQFELVLHDGAQFTVARQSCPSFG
jgi:hypothetical protein